jgi:hypothetical protein
VQVLQVQLEIRPDPAEVGRARRWVRSRLAGSGVSDDEPLAETLILLVSELVTNAVVHTGRPAVLRLTFQGVCGAQTGAQGVAGGIVRLEVVDLSACPPAPRHAERDETNRIIMDELVRGVLRPESTAVLQRMIDGLKARGCDAVALGCTELPLVLNDGNSALPTLDSTRLLARAALRHATA